MSNYLWDRSGAPDPEVERLEALLDRYRHDAPLRIAPLVPKRRRWLAAVAALLLFAAVTLAVTFALRFNWRSGAAWAITSVTGTPTLDGRPIDRRARLDVGEELRTDATSRVTLQVARIGEIEVGPDSRVSLAWTGRKRHRVRLESGTITARVWAPPFAFGVHTPAGDANDLGCAFTLRYEQGAGEVVVTSGWVEFESAIRSSVIPAGAMVLLRDEGSGTPFYPDASPELRAALYAFDFEERREALAGVIAYSRPRDAMTLLHLLERSQRYPEWRGPLFDRLAQLAPPPPGVTREGIVHRDRSELGLYRESLGLGGVKKWWLQWRDALPNL